jgi:hypothetical protein
MKNKKIEFVSIEEEVQQFVTSPLPSKKYIPKWYKDSFMYYESNSISFFSDDKTKAKKTIKHCIPVFDSITCGYIQETWTDIYIKENQGEVEYAWSIGPEIIGSRNKEMKQKMPCPPGCNETLLDWKMHWVPKTPFNYSVLITHPMYRFDLPFVTTPGIFDSDKFNMPGTAPSFFLKKGFSGIIPKGTPMYQIIPYKKESWKSYKEGKKYEEVLKKQFFEINSRFFSSYKKMFWNKVKYE